MINDNFTRLMKQADFKSLEQCKTEKIELPVFITATSPLGQRPAGTKFVRVNKANINAPYETIHVNTSTKDPKRYFMYLEDDNGNQMRVGKGAMSLEELSARVLVNASKSVNAANNVPHNPSEEEIILSTLKKHHFANWKNVLEENKIPVSEAFRETMQKRESNGGTVFVRFINIGESKPSKLDIITYYPKSLNPDFPLKAGFFRFEPSSYNNLPYAKEQFTQDDLSRLDSDLTKCERRNFDYYNTSAPLHFNEFKEIPKAEPQKRDNFDVERPKTGRDDSVNVRKTRKNDNTADETIAAIEQKSKASKANGLTFADIGGQDDAIKKMKRTILFPIRYPEAFKNRKISHGVVLYGPPGTGKSLLAETLANEADAHYIKLNGLEMISKWVGQSEENLRKLFDEARKNQPTVIFIDEFDGIACSRDSERDPHGAKVVNMLLTLFSDIEKNGDNIFVVTATNRLDRLDPAIVRSGRMETHIKLVAPVTVQDVKQIFDIHTKKLDLSEDLNKDAIAHALLQKHATGADIASVISLASENSYDRHDYSPNAKSSESIYEKMDERTFELSDLENNPITNEDFAAAIKEKYGTTVYFSPKAIKTEENLSETPDVNVPIINSAYSQNDDDVIID